MDVRMEGGDNRRQILTNLFPEYDVDMLLASMTKASAEQIADWCLNNPDRVPKKKKAQKRRFENPEDKEELESDLEFDDIADNLILDRFVKELLSKFKKEMALQDNICVESPSHGRHFLGAVFPMLRMEFIRDAFKETGYRLCATLIVGFFVQNKLIEKIRDCMQNPQSLMWIRTDQLASKRKKAVVKLFDDNLAEHQPYIREPAQKFIKIMNDLVEKYPEIVYQMELKPEAKTLRVEVPEEIEKFSCNVCFDDYSITQRITCGTGLEVDGEEERHSFCRTCVRQQAQAATAEMPLHQNGLGFKCMQYRCQNAILYSVVRSFIPKGVRKRIDERITEENLGRSGLELERCRDCNFAIEMEESKEENKVFACLNCEKNWCRMCGRDWDGDHFGLTCGELDEKQNVDKRQRDLERRLNEAVIRRCKCGLQFTKGDGCNKMTCRCGATLCYICRQENITYAHFCQHVRNPGEQRCQNCNNPCTLWADATQIDEEAMQRIREEAGMPGPSRPRGRSVEDRRVHFADDYNRAPHIGMIPAFNPYIPPPPILQPQPIPLQFYYGRQRRHEPRGFEPLNNINVQVNLNPPQMPQLGVNPYHPNADVFINAPFGGQRNLRNFNNNREEEAVERQHQDIARRYRLEEYPVLVQQPQEAAQPLYHQFVERVLQQHQNQMPADRAVQEEAQLPNEILEADRRMEEMMEEIDAMRRQHRAAREERFQRRQLQNIGEENNAPVVRVAEDLGGLRNNEERPEQPAEEATENPANLPVVEADPPILVEDDADEDDIIFEQVIHHQNPLLNNGEVIDLTDDNSDAEDDIAEQHLGIIERITGGGHGIDGIPRNYDVLKDEIRKFAGDAAFVARLVAGLNERNRRFQEAIAELNHVDDDRIQNLENFLEVNQTCTNNFMQDHERLEHAIDEFLSE